MREEDAVRLLRAGLLAPGWTDNDAQELIKSGRLTTVSDSRNRGAYWSDASETFSWWGVASQDRKPPRTVAFPVLRMKLIQSPIDKLIILRRMSQMRRVAQRCVVPGRQVGYRVVHERYADPDWAPDDSIKQRCVAMERLLGAVVTELHRDVKQFAATAIHEELVVDRKVMLKFINPVTKKPVAYNMIDGTTVIPRIEALFPFMQKHNISDIDTAAEQYSYQLYSENIRDAAGKPIDLTRAAYVQKIDERITGAWPADEMSVDIVNREIELDQIMYGKSALEQSLEITDGFINAWGYNMMLFAPNFPENILVVKGDYDARGLENFKRTMLQQTTMAGPQRVPVITGDSKDFEIQLEKLREAPKDAQFAELLRMIVALKCAAYGMHPSEINFSPDGGESKAMINEGSEDVAQEAATEDGFYSVLDNLATWWTEALIRPYYDDLLVVWEGIKPDNEKMKVELNVQKVANYMGVNEMRGSENLPAIDFNSLDISTLDIGRVPLNPVLATLIQAKQQQNQMDQQMAQMNGAQPADPNGDYGMESEGWENAGRGEGPPDHGKEQPDWFMRGQEKASGRSNFEPDKPARKSQAGRDDLAKSTVKYLRLEYVDGDD